MLMLVEHDYEASESRLDTVYTFIRDGRTETRRAAHWIYTVSEIRRLFARRGLETVAVLGDLAGAPFAVGDHQLYLIFEKRRSEEHTSELQSLMRLSYAVFCLKKKKK